MPAAEKPKAGVCAKGARSHPSFRFGLLKRAIWPLPSDQLPLTRASAPGVLHRATTAFGNMDDSDLHLTRRRPSAGAGARLVQQEPSEVLRMAAQLETVSWLARAFAAEWAQPATRKPKTEASTITSA